MKRLTPAKLTMMMFMVVGGLIAAYIAKGLLATDVKPTPPAIRNVPMPVADLPAGTLVTENHLGMGPIAVKDLTRDVLLQNRVITGRITKEPLKAATAIKSGQLYEKGASPPLTVGKDMSAISIPLATSALIDGLIKPGQYVDVHFSTLPSDRDPRFKGGMSMTLFKGVKLLAINRQFQQSPIDDNRTNSATLEVTTEQANILLVLQPRGTLSLSFNPEGKGDGHLALADKDRATLDEILKLEPIKTPEPPPPPFMSQIYRGTGRQELEFKKNGAVTDRFGGVPTRRDPITPQDLPADSTPTGNDANGAPGSPTGNEPAAPQSQRNNPPNRQDPQPRTASVKSA